MFSFKNKTIKKLRDEILSSQGKEVKTQGGTTVFIGNIEELKIHWLSFWNGNISYKDGEFDFEKNCGNKKMYGFFVEVYNIQNEYKVARNLLIHIPYEDRLKKCFVEINDKDSILSNLK